VAENPLSERLKPCPFCETRLARNSTFSMRNRDCYVHVQDLNGVDYGRCPAVNIRIYSDDIERIASWNRRLPDMRAISEDGPHVVGDHRRWLARQLLDSQLSDAEAYGVVRSSPGLSGEDAPSFAILKGVGKANGDGWKDVTVKGETVFAWGNEKPGPYKRGQFDRLGCDAWSASVDQYEFSPATAEDVPAIRALLSASSAAKAEAMERVAVELEEMASEERRAARASSGGGTGDAAATMGFIFGAVAYETAAKRIRATLGAQNAQEQP